MKTAHINDLGEKQSVKEHLSGTAERAYRYQVCRRIRYGQSLWRTAGKQAAGRCNREGRRPVEESVVSFFRLEGSNSGFLSQNISAFR